MEYNFNIGNISGINNQISNVSNIANVKLTSGNTNAALLNSISNNSIILNGVVQNSSTNGAITLQTELGQINLQSNFFIKKGAEIALKIEQKQNAGYSELIAKLISIDGVSPAKYIAIQNNHNLNVHDEIIASSEVIASNNIEGIITESEVASTNLASPIIRGVFLQSSKITPDLIALINGAAQNNVIDNNLIKTGTALQLQISNIMIPDEVSLNDFLLQNNSATSNAPINNLQITDKRAVTPTNLSTALPTSPLPKAEALTNNQTTASPAKPSPLTPNIAPPPATIADGGDLTNSQPEALNPKPYSLTPNQANQPKTLSNILTQYIKPQINNAISSLSNITSNNNAKPTLAFSGVVLEQTSNREVTLQTDIGIIKLFLSTPLPKGSIVQFNLLQIEQVRGNDVIDPNIAATVSDSEILEALSEIVELKHVSNAPTSNFSGSHIVPRLGATLGSEILFLISAFKAGNLQDFIGANFKQKINETIEGETKINKLNAAFQHLKGDFKLEEENNWQHMLIPLYDGEKINPINFFLKNQKGNKASKTNDISHFMLELRLDDFGIMQLDGLVQRNKYNTPKTKQFASKFASKFDLIIRSENPFPSIMKQEIANIFNEYCQITGNRGTIQFRSGANAIQPPPKITNTNHNLNELIV
jgi:hypothetical protein